MTYNAADEDSVEEREQERKNERTQELEDLKTLLSLPAGVRFLTRLFRSGEYLTSSIYTGNSGTFYKAGKMDTVSEYFLDVVKVSRTKAVDILAELEKERSE